MDDIETQVELIQCNINSNIRYLRAINGLTLRQLGSVSGVSPHTISKLEKKKYVNIPIKSLLKLCYVFPLDVLDILFKDLRENSSIENLLLK